MAMGGPKAGCGIRFDEERGENAKAMVDFPKDYGIYK